MKTIQNTQKPEKLYSVNLWGSHPDACNDDCWTGDDFATEQEARAAAANWMQHFDVNVLYAAYIEIDGPCVHVIIKNAGFKPSRDDDSDWKRERANQAGMAFGCDGYNDEMGY